MAKNGKKHAPAPAGDKPKACYVLSLSVENVRCFGPKQTLDLSDGNGRPAQWTIILGENGTGKTTLLQALVYLEALPRPEADNLLHFISRPCRFYQQLLQKPNARNVDPLGIRRSTALPSAASCKSEWACESGGIGIANWSSRPGEIDCVPFPERLIFYAYGAARRLSRGALTEDNSDPVATIFDDDTHIQNAEEWLILLDYLSSRYSENQKLYKARLARVVELLCSGVLPGTHDVRFVTEEIVNPTPRAEFLTDYGWVPLRQLGYGYQTLIAWMLDFVSRMVERYPDSADPLKEPAICVVDEIDLHLHPAWQRKLIGFLSERFPNTQFIATAHSPLVVQAAENANIAVLRREGDHVVIDNDVDNIRNWRVDQILTSDLFGLESARSPEVEKLLARNEELLAKPKLTAAEKRELKEVERKIGELPTWANPGEKRDLDKIRSILERLERSSPK
jgi:hypothetical protein